jgi:GxxExxY protein
VNPHPLSVLPAATDDVITRVDLVVENLVIVEIKAVARMDPIFQAKVISYLRSTKLRAGLRMNLNAPLIKDGIQRIVV